MLDSPALGQFGRPVKAAQAARQRFDQLAVNDGNTDGSEGRIATSTQAGKFRELAVDDAPAPNQVPWPKGVIDGAPCSVLTREIAPGTIVAQHVKYAIDDALYVRRSRAAARFGKVDQGSE